MHTNRSETRSISIQASPAKVLDLVGDANALPRWAPNFAASVRAENGHWVVDDELLIDLRVDRELGTVDILRARAPADRRLQPRRPQRRRQRVPVHAVLPRRHRRGAAVTQQMTVVEEELRTIRALCE